ncbi:putative GDSL esterase/lipase [Cocos nucifera]|uniref:Putative GDSL esterase/lipase n=1 Tax=Cocos nucifera TaxID=13894 RepID=A0A8K0HYJ5_COCNU|nr:putative GDSL esterase/lipase [Cocos nucifera]
MKPSLLAFLLFPFFHLCYCAQRYDAIFSFGDSLSDAGNLIVNNPSAYLTSKWPYAEAFGLPLPPPSLKDGEDFQKRENFATTGGTVLDYSFFQERGLTKSIFTTDNMKTQLSWFEKMKPSLCGTTQGDCKDYIGKSLFVFGEFGGNDYNAFLFSGKSMDEVRKNTPNIVDGLAAGVERLISNGALDVVVPGILPIGCFPLYLQLYKSSNKDDYNQFGCLKRYNKVASYHNQLLKIKLQELQQKYPGTRIIYGDFYNAAKQFVVNPKNYAEAFGLPLPPPSLKDGEDFQKGANFATTGGTVLDYSFFQERGLTKSIFTTDNMKTQLSWFEKMKPSLCGTTQGDCQDYIGKSLFVFGEFGGNDYNAFLFSGKSMDEVRKNTPNIVDGLAAGVERLISNGALDVVVPGILPIGCFPLYLQLYKSSNKDDYNQFGCLKRYNKVASYHNQLLKIKLQELQQKYPGTRIIYGDFYNAAKQFVVNPKNYGEFFLHNLLVMSSV